MDVKKMECMLNWPYPNSVKEVRGFLGLTGYYRHFIQNYGVLAQPLTTLLKKNSFEQSEAVREVWDTLKAMVTALVLALPNFDDSFTVESDASSGGISAVLTQNGRPIAYFSKALGPKHQVLSIYEWEMLAIIAAVKKWTA